MSDDARVTDAEVAELARLESAATPGPISEAEVAELDGRVLANKDFFSGMVVAVDLLRRLLAEREAMRAEIAGAGSEGELGGDIADDLRTQLVAMTKERDAIRSAFADYVPADIGKLLAQLAVSHASLAAMTKRAERAERNAGAMANELRIANEERDQARRERGVAYMGIDGVWRWQGDGSDAPKSLACPVVMRADTLREMLARAERAEADRDSADAALDRERGLLARVTAERDALAKAVAAYIEEHGLEHDDGNDYDCPEDDTCECALVLDLVARSRRCDARWEVSNEACLHEKTTRGPNVPLRYGSLRSEVCEACGAGRTTDHHGGRASRWAAGPIVIEEDDE